MTASASVHLRADDHAGKYSRRDRQSAPAQALPESVGEPKRPAAKCSGSGPFDMRSSSSPSTPKDAANNAAAGTRSATSPGANRYTHSLPLHRPQTVAGLREPVVPD